MDVPALKDSTTERPIPSAWRPIIKEIVAAFVRQDYSLLAGIPGVLPISAETADHIRNYLRSYGEVLVDLPEESWASSVCIWMGHRWEALIDLWTAAEGRSDLALSLHVRDTVSGPEFDVIMVYVP